MSSAAEKMEEGALPPPVQATGVTTVQPMNVTTSSAPMYQQEKMGSKCCGCCCDYRRAVIVISILFICFTALTLILSVTAASIPGFNNVDDDDVEAILENATLRTIIISAIALVMAIVGLLGARLFNIPMLAMVVLWFVIQYALDVWIWIDNVDQANNLEQTTVLYRYPIGWMIFEAFITGLWIYPHVGLILEIKKGIMSRETYPREEYSCCCIDKRNTGYNESRTRTYQ